MLLMIEIVLTTALVGFFIYLNKQQAKMFIKKVTSDRLFPKIFWGVMLGVGFLCFSYWLRRAPFDELNIINYVKIFHKTIQVRGLYLIIGPFFGVFAGIAVGASTRPFSLKKLFICIFASFIGGLILSIKLYLSETTKPIYIPTSQTCDLLVYSLILTPLAIGISDKSLFKIIIGSIGGVLGYCLTWVLVIIMAGLGGANFWFGNSSPIAGFLGYLGFVFGTVLIILGIELPEVMDVTTVKEFFKNK